MPARCQLRPLSLCFWSLLALLALGISSGLVAHLEAGCRTPALPPRFDLQTYAAIDQNWIGDDPRIRRIISRDQDTISADYRFISYQNDPVEVRVTVPGTAYRDYRKAFGYRQEELDVLFEQQKQALEQAQAWAVANHASQQQLDQAAAKISGHYEQAVSNLLQNRGFRFLDNGLLAADIPTIARNNVSLFQPVALSLQQTMRQLGYSESATIGTALPLVQTAIAYEALPTEENGRITAGFSPPLEVFMEGRGDCDAKSALLAAILLNWDQVRLLGVGVPGHYLLGILQHPGKGDAFVEYEGMTYVLMEPSGPAWVPPGIISDYTLKWLDSQDQVILEKITLN